MKNVIIETGASRYNLVYGEYEDCSYGVPTAMCCFAWLKTSRGGPSFAWPKGDNLYASYVLEKTDINMADLTGILSAIKAKFPGSVGEMMCFDENYMFNEDLHCVVYKGKNNE